jgi:cell division protein YceG involved in septum cleavage
MDTKLTLKLDRQVIEKAKKYAASRNRSLSRMIESYLRSIVEKEAPDSEDDPEISSFIRSLRSGVKIPADLDLKKEYGDYLSEKHQ